MIEIVAGVCLLAAVWCWWTGLRAMLRGLRSKSWPAASGVIRTTSVVKKHNSKGREVWRHEIEYSYSVAGASYRGSRFQFGIPASLSWLDPSDPSFQQFRPGATVAVIHDPSRPSVSALRRGCSPFALLTLVAGGVIAGIGVWLLRLPG
jgi:hypothetical protein